MKEYKYEHNVHHEQLQDVLNTHSQESWNVFDIFYSNHTWLYGVVFEKDKTNFDKLAGKLMSDLDALTKFLKT